MSEIKNVTNEEIKEAFARIDANMNVLADAANSFDQRYLELMIVCETLTRIIRSKIDVSEAEIEKVSTEVASEFISAIEKQRENEQNPKEEK